MSEEESTEMTVDTAVTSNATTTPQGDRWKSIMKNKNKMSEEQDTEMAVDTAVTSNDTTAPQGDGWKSTMKAIASQIPLLVPFLALWFVLMGLVNGWDDAQHYIIGFSMVCVSFLVMSHLSIDSHLNREGMMTHGTITNRKEEKNRFCQGNAIERYIQYTYCIDGVVYENNEAWFQFSNNEAWFQFPDSDQQLCNDVDIKYIKGRPEISLPCTRRKNVIPSAGSLNSVQDCCCSWSMFVFSVLWVFFDVAAYMVFKKAYNFTNEPMTNFLSHLVGLPISGLLYYYCWMRRCEQKQQFTAHPKPLTNQDTDGTLT